MRATVGASDGSVTSVRWFDRAAFGAVLPGWVLARVLVVVAFVVADAIAVEQALDPRPLHLDQGLITWDGDFYEQLARSGYAQVPFEAVRFFPLFPALGWVLGGLLGGHHGPALILVANAVALLAAVGLRGLVLDTTGDVRLADRSAWYVNLFPTATVFVLAYGESLFLLASVVYIGAVQRRRWAVAVLAGLAAGLTRPVAVVLALPALVVLWPDIRASVRSWPPVAAVVAAPAAGTLAFLAWVEVRLGSWRDPIDLQRQLRAGFRWAPARLWDGIVEVVSEAQHDAPNIAFAVLWLFLLVVVARRQPTAWFAYAAASAVVALSAQNLDSTGRYALVVFPLVVAVAGLAETERWHATLTGLCSAGLVGLGVMTLVGGYTP